MHKSLAQRERPNRLQAVGAFFCARGDRLVVKDAATTPPKRQFEPGSSRQLASGTACVAAPTAPGLQPRDWAPEHPTVCNVMHAARHFYGGQSPMSDWARHEYPLPRQAD